MKCSICHSSDIDKYFEVKNSPLLQNILFESELAATNTEVVDAAFFVCNNCDLLFNPRFQAIAYDKTYNNDQNYSEAYRSHLNNIADIVEGYLLPGRKLLEIGCGNGAFLEILYQRGCKNIIGYDPANTGHLQFVKKSYWNTQHPESYDVIVMRHTLEGIPNVVDFFSSVAQRVNSDGVIYLELTNARFILENASTHTLYNECAQYFSESSIGYFLNLYSFYVDNMYHMMGDEILGIVGRKKIIRKPIVPALCKLSNFNKICIWGISGRSIHFLSNYKINKDVIQFGVDVDPKKQGKYIPVTGQRVISPEKCNQLRPDAIVVLNDNYVTEVTEVISKFDYPVKILRWRDMYEF